MLYFDQGLFLRQPKLGIDVTRAQAAGFISHAHFDHMARHRTVYCTHATGLFFNHRVCPREIRELPFGKSTGYGNVELTTFAAGHILGSAMLSISDGQQSVLYSGDFQFNASKTAEAADPPLSDTLVMECTFGRPEFVMPDRDLVVEQLIATIRSILSNGNVPVLHAYALGKAQEITKILSSEKFKIYQHPEIFRLSQLYEQLGCSLGPFSEYPGQPRPGSVVILPPREHRAASVGSIPRAERIGLTGWALKSGCRKKLRVDHVFPFSDHADYPQLIELIERVQPKKVYCTHGSKGFVDDLCQRGFDARWLDRKTAYCLS